MIDAAANLNRAYSTDKRPVVLNSSPMSTTVETNADNTSRRWSIEHRTETPSRMSVTSHLFKYFSRRSVQGPSSEDANLSDLREELKQVRGEFEDALSQLEQAKAAIRAREAQLNRFEETNEYCQKLLHRNSELELTIGRVQDEFEARLRDLEKYLNDTESAKVDAREQHAAELAAHSTTRLELNAMRDKYDLVTQQNSRISEQVALITKEANSLRDSLTEALNEKSSTEGGLKTLREEYDNFRSIYQRQLAEITSTSDSVKDVLRENMSLNMDKATLNALRSDLELKNSQLRQSLLQAREENRRLAEDAQNKQVQLETIYSSYEKLKQSLIAITGIDAGSVSAVSSGALSVESIMALRSQVDKLNADLDEKNSRYQVRVNELEVSNMRMKEQLKNYDQVHQTAADLLKRNQELEQQQRAIGSMPSQLKAEKRKREEATVDLNKARKEIKSLEAHVLALNKRLNEELNGRSSPGSERVLNMLDKSFIESLKNDHNSEIRALHESMTQEINRMRAQERETAALDLNHALETQERNLRSKFIDEFAERLKAHEQATDAHYKELIDSLDKQSKNRVAELKSQLANTKAKYESMIEAISAEYDEKMLSAATEMDRIMRAKNEELGQLRSSLLSSNTQCDVLDQELTSLRRKLDELQKAYQSELRELRDKTSHSQLAATTPRASVTTNPELDSLVQSLKDSFEAEKARLLQKITEAETEVKTKLNENTDLQRKCLELEGVAELKNSELRTLKEELLAAEKASSARKIDSANLQKMIQRNKELEDTICILSEKLDCSLRDREQELSNARATNARRQTLQVVEVESASSLSLIQSLQHKISELELARSQLATSLAHNSAGAAAEPKATTPDNGAERLRELYGKILAKLEALSNNVQEGVDLDRKTREASAQLIDKQIDRMKLTRQVELLQAARDQRVAAIEKLESDLRRAELSSAKVPSRPSVDPSIEVLYRQTLIERDELKQATEKLRAANEEKSRTLRDEIQLRNSQLKLLEESKTTLSGLLGRNSELESEIRNLFASPPPNFPAKTNFERLEHLLISLESNNTAVNEAHSLEVLRLQQCIDERENDRKALERDQRKLESELRAAEALKLKLADQEWNAKLQEQMSENRRLRDLLTNLENNYNALKRDSQNSLDEAETRFQEMIKSISSQLSQNDLFIAEIQEKKNSEIEDIQTSLKLSLEAQALLNAEIETVQMKLDERSNEYNETQHNLRLLMEELNRNSSSTSEGQADSDTLQALRNRFQELVRQLQSSQNESERLRNYFDALIKRQENEISMAQEQKRQLQGSSAFTGDAELTAQLDHVESALRAQAALSKSQKQSLENFRGSFPGLDDIQDNLAKANALGERIQRETANAMAKAEGSGLIAGTLSRIVHRVQSLVQTIETRTTTSSSEVPVDSQGPASSSTKRRLTYSASPEEVTKRPRV